MSVAVRSRRRRVVVLRRSRWRMFRRAVTWLTFLGVGAGLGFFVWFVAGDDLPVRVARPIVNDVSQLNPIPVARIVYPTTIPEVQRVVRDWPGPIAIGGGHYSMGGQTACEGCLSLDMRKLDRVLELDVARRLVRVEAGITWHKLQAAIDPQGLAVSIMQTYANFTVGGALSVNAHGRYVGGGPIVRSVQSIEMVMADGTLITASPVQNPELFFGAIGGYGGLGVIVTATLMLAPNTRIARDIQVMPLRSYPSYFAKQVRDSQRAVFHNADLYPPEYDTVSAQTWSETERPLTNSARFIKPKPPTLLARGMLFWMTELPLGHAVRRHVYDPMLFDEKPVVWRNHEASYDVMELEPSSRRDSTYALQEFFVPVARLGEFVPKLRSVLVLRDVNAVNISIRHALPDPGTLLAWARDEVFSLVLYYKQGTDAEARKDAGVWMRESIDAVLALGGTYYLPYQAHATLDQLRRAYPRFDEYFALKKRVDPRYRFRNKLWDKYIPPQDDQARARRALHALPKALRAEERTFLAVPERYLAFSADEYASHLASAPPSEFPFLEGTNQLWTLYRAVYHRTRHRYPTGASYLIENTLLGLSYSVQTLFEGAYETTLGRVSEWFACPGEWQLCNAEDRYAAETARAYHDFLRSHPWYMFPFNERLRGLWHLDSSKNHSWFRTAERRVFLTLDYVIKAVSASSFRAVTPTPSADQTTLSWFRRPDAAPLPPGAKSLSRFGEEEVAYLPRTDGFRECLRTLAATGIDLREIAGHDFIATSWLIPRDFDFDASTEVTTRWPLLTDPDRERALVFSPVATLTQQLQSLEARGARLDHVFDY